MKQPEWVKSKRASSMIEVNGYLRCVYHDTEVVRFNKDEIILDSGGWETVTTKRRMNEVSREYDLGFGVYQQNYIWYVRYMGLTFAFEDNMILPRKFNTKEALWFWIKMMQATNQTNLKLL